MYIAHLADDDKPLTTLCGEPWEAWQDPTIPTNEEIKFDELPYAQRVEVRKAVRKADEARKPKPGDLIRQCQACRKIFMRGGFAHSA